MAEKNMIKEYIGSPADKRVDIIMKNYTRSLFCYEIKIRKDIWVWKPLTATNVIRNNRISSKVKDGVR